MASKISFGSSWCKLSRCTFNWRCKLCVCSVSIHLNAASMTRCGSYEAGIRCISSLYCGAGPLMHASGWYLRGTVWSSFTRAAVSVVVVRFVCLLHFSDCHIVFCVVITLMDFDLFWCRRDDSLDQSHATRQRDEANFGQAAKFLRT